ncbi:MAG: ISAs1 family transposase [Psychromonas sp.]|nr:ISAs1 family transposase [Psychromonas sp.]
MSPNTCSSRYYIGSSELTSEHFLNATRDHCSIENRLHWKLDVGMGEDQCRIRRENVVGKLASVHHIALNLLKSTTSFKAGIKRKLHKANRCDIYRDKRSELVKKSKLNTILQK